MAHPISVFRQFALKLTFRYANPGWLIAPRQRRICTRTCEACHAWLWCRSDHCALLQGDDRRSDPLIVLNLWHAYIRAAQVGWDANVVVAMRLMRLAVGGALAQREAQRMVLRISTPRSESIKQRVLTLSSSCRPTPLFWIGHRSPLPQRQLGFRPFLDIANTRKAAGSLAME